MIEQIRAITDAYAETLSPDGDWAPTLFLVKDNDIAISTFSMPPNGAIREFFFESVLPNQIRSAEPDAVIVLVSTWMSQAMDEEDFQKMEKGEGPMPSERPDRKEAVVIQGVSKDEEFCAMGEIIRSDGPPELEWESFSEVAEMQGRMMASLRRGVWG